MGTILEFNGIKIRINPRDHYPPHVHIVGKGGHARYDIARMGYMDAEGFTFADLRHIEEAIKVDIDIIHNEWERLHETK
jgi:hypothetical protein